MLCLLTISSALAADDGLATTPPRGWRSWNALRLDISQDIIARQLAELDASGLLAAGYTRLGVDDGWQACGAGVNGSFHDASGAPIVNRSRFPDPAALGADADARGAQLGWYANNCWCCEAGLAPPRVEQDVALARAVGARGLKVDGCGPARNISAWKAALDAGGGGVLLENCNDGASARAGADGAHRSPTPAEVRARCDFHMYRVSLDVGPQFLSAMFNLNALAPYLAANASRPGCWAYGDMLEVGRLASAAEDRAHFAGWCVASSPLVLGVDLANATQRARAVAVAAHARANAVNQAWAGTAGGLVANASANFTAAVCHGARCATWSNETFPSWQLWAKPLAPCGAVAALAVHLGGTAATVDVAIDAISVGVGDGCAQRPRQVGVDDIWSGTRLAVIAPNGTYVAQAIPQHDSVFVTLTPLS